MALVLIGSPRFAEHVTPPGHPERAERADVFDAVMARWRSRATCLEPSPASRDDLLRVHSPQYVNMVAATAGHARELDPDTYTSPASHEIALLAAGASCLAVDRAMDARGPAVALVRPPGHHAEPEQAMGFCLYNNAAIAAAYARSSRLLSRVAIVDFDVHHGNGTQWAFYDDPGVFYISTHQFPYYPGTGGPAEIGKGRGAGFTMNVPLEAGATDADYDLAFRSLIVPVLDAWAPELLVVSAGYDAHHRVPLAGMRVSTEGFAAMVAHLGGVAARHCHGSVVVVTEGGYDLPALSDSLEVTLETLDAGCPAPAPIHGDDARAREAAELVRAILQPFWPTL
jgi:acetoin utilization deacetylase AcuC-like enzyme